MPLWGVSFVVVKVALGDVPPLAFVASAFVLAARIAPSPGSPRAAPAPELRTGRRPLVGHLLGIGFATQGVGLVDTTPSRSAFSSPSRRCSPRRLRSSRAGAPGRRTIAALVVGRPEASTSSPAPERGRAESRRPVDPDHGGALRRPDRRGARGMARRHDVLRLVWLRDRGHHRARHAGAAALDDPVSFGPPGLWERWRTPRSARPSVTLLLQMRAQREMYVGTSLRAVLSESRLRRHHELALAGGTTLADTVDRGGADCGRAGTGGYEPSAISRQPSGRTIWLKSPCLGVIFRASN